MPRLFTLQTNFSSGELDPLMHFRVDTGAYRNGARTLRNALLYASGGCARRPGTLHLALLQGNTRLLPFEFSADERYILALSDKRLDVYLTNGSLVTSVTTGISWTTAELFALTYAQVADTVMIAHTAWAPQVITRTGASTFTVTNFAFAQASNGDKIYQPYFKFVDDAVTLSLSGTTGSVTMTANAGVFTADMVGQRLRWQDTEIEVTAFTNTTTMTGTVKGTVIGTLDINPLRVAQGSTTVTVTHVAHGFATGDTVTISDAGDVGGVTAANLNGARTITVTSDNTYTFTAGGAAATQSVDGGGPSVKFSGTNLPTRQWFEPVFCARNGYPGAVTFHEGRLWFGGSGGIPDGLWASRIFEYFNFDVGDGDDDDSIQRTLGSDDISIVRHLVSNGDLQIFTANGEFFAPSPTTSSLTPGNMRVKRQQPYGASKVAPLIFDGATVYIQASGTALREYLFAESAQRYASTNLTLLAGHLMSQPVDMAVLYGSTDRSEQYAIVVNDNGTLAIFHSARAEELAGWTPWALGGQGTPQFKSAITLGDEIFVTVLRGGTYRLEKFDEHDGVTIDGATAFTAGVATNTWALGSLYANATVAVTSGNYYLGSYTADGSGNVTLDVAVNSIVAGYDYTFSIKTLPVDVELQTGPTTGRPKRISRVIVGLYSTLALSISGNRLILRQVTDDMSKEPEVVTGTYEFRLLGFQRDAFVEITQVEPLACRVLGMSMEVMI